MEACNKRIDTRLQRGGESLSPFFPILQLPAYPQAQARRRLGEGGGDADAVPCDQQWDFGRGLARAMAITVCQFSVFTVLIGLSFGLAFWLRWEAVEAHKAKRDAYQDAGREMVKAYTKWARSGHHSDSQEQRAYKSRKQAMKDLQASVEHSRAWLKFLSFVLQYSKSQGSLDAIDSAWFC